MCNKTRFYFLASLWILLCYPSVSFSDTFSLARGFFYSHQYEKAAECYAKELGSLIRPNAEINYRIGLCYYLMGDVDRSQKFWGNAKKENSGIFKGRSFRISSKAKRKYPTFAAVECFLGRSFSSCEGVSELDPVRPSAFFLSF